MIQFVSHAITFDREITLTDDTKAYTVGNELGLIGRDRLVIYGIRAIPEDFITSLSGFNLKRLMNR